MLGHVKIEMKEKKYTVKLKLNVNLAPLPHCLGFSNFLEVYIFLECQDYLDESDPPHFATMQRA